MSRQDLSPFTGNRDNIWSKQVQLKNYASENLAPTLSKAGSNVASLIKSVSDPIPEYQELVDAESLGICYVTNRIIAMGFPHDKSHSSHTKTPDKTKTSKLCLPSSHINEDKRSNSKCDGGNSNSKSSFNTQKDNEDCNPMSKLSAMSRYFDRYHKSKYMIFNISEKSYDYKRFHNQVMEFKFPGYPAPSLHKIFWICSSIDSQLLADPQNIAIVHCQTGRGRTLLTIAFYLAWTGQFSTPKTALDHVLSLQKYTSGISSGSSSPSPTHKEDRLAHIIIPTQKRYLEYYTKMLVYRQMPSLSSIKIERFIFNGVPNFKVTESNKTFKGCRPVLHIVKNARLLQASWKRTSTDAQDGVSKTLSFPNAYSIRDESILFNVGLIVNGDILIRVQHLTDEGYCVSVLRFGFHTGYIEPGVVRFCVQDIDGACKDQRFSSDFQIDMNVSPVSESEEDAELDEIPFEQLSPRIKDPNYQQSVVDSRNNRIRQQKKTNYFDFSEEGKFGIISSGDEDELGDNVGFNSDDSRSPITAGSSIDSDNEMRSLDDVSQDIGIENSRKTSFNNAKSDNNKIKISNVSKEDYNSKNNSLEQLPNDEMISKLKLMTISTSEPVGKTSEKERIDELERYIEGLNEKNNLSSSPEYDEDPDCLSFDDNNSISSFSDVDTDSTKGLP